MKATLPLWVTAAGILAATQFPARADCTCRAYGKSFDHGQIACILAPSGPFLARCGKVLNNSSWLKIHDGCPQASLLPPSHIPPVVEPPRKERPPGKVVPPDPA